MLMDIKTWSWGSSSSSIEGGLDHTNRRTRLTECHKVSHPPSNRGTTLRLVHVLLEREKVVKDKSLITTSPPPLHLLGNILVLTILISVLKNCKSIFSLY